MARRYAQYLGQPNVYPFFAEGPARNQTDDQWRSSSSSIHPRENLPHHQASYPPQAPLNPELQIGFEPHQTTPYPNIYQPLGRSKVVFEGPQGYSKQEAHYGGYQLPKMGFEGPPGYSRQEAQYGGYQPPKVDFEGPQGYSKQEAHYGGYQLPKMCFEGPPGYSKQEAHYGGYQLPKMCFEGPPGYSKQEAQYGGYQPPKVDFEGPQGYSKQEAQFGGDQPYRSFQGPSQPIHQPPQNYPSPICGRPSSPYQQQQNMADFERQCGQAYLNPNPQTGIQPLESTQPPYARPISPYQPNREQPKTRYGMPNVEGMDADHMTEMIKTEKVTMVMEEGQLMLIKTHGENTLRTIERELADHNVKIDIGPKALTITGTADGLTLTKGKLDSIFNNIVKKQILISEAPCVKLLTTGGPSVVEKVAEDVQCIVQVAEDGSTTLTGGETKEDKKREEKSDVAASSEGLPTLYIGNIEQQQVDIIVNTTNTKLKLLELKGMSAALAAGAGDDMQEECSRRYPKGISPGELAITTGGMLQCMHVFHTSLPAYKEKSARQNIKDIVKRCLTEGSNRKAKSIAFPAFGTGQLRYDQRLVAECMRDAIQEFWRTNPNTTLTDVRIILHAKNKETIDVFRKEIKQKDPGLKAFRSRRGEPFRKSVRNVTVEQGNLAKQKVNVIVNTTNKDLNLSASGGVATALLKEGGHDLQKECNKEKKEIGKGQVVMTKPGNLCCKKVYHVNLSEATDKRNQREEIADIVDNVLILAHNNSVGSIAFPALGTGVLKYDRHLVAEQMLKTMHKFWIGNPKTSLKDVRIIIYDAETKKAFREVEDNSDNLVFGSLVDCKADVIVNSIDENFNLDCCNLSKCIIAKGGKKVEKEFQKNCSKDFPLVVTSAGNLEPGVGHIYHVEVPSFTPDRGEENLQRAVWTCLKEADSSSRRSIRFPTLGIGAPRYPYDVSAQVLLKTVNQFLRSHPDSTLQDVQIVIHEEKIEKVYRDVQASFQQTAASSRQKRFHSKTDREKRPAKTHAKKQMKVTFIAWSHEDTEKAERLFHEACRKEIITKTEENEDLQTLSHENIEELREMGSQLGVLLHLSEKDRKVSVTGCTADVDKILLKIYGFILEKKKTEGVKWFWVNEINEEVDFDPGVIGELENAYKSGDDSHKLLELFDAKGSPYVVNLSTWVMHDQGDPSIKHVVKRRQTRKDAYLELPLTWEKCTDPNRLQFDVDPTSKEYRDVSTRFTKSVKTPKHSARKILNIARIQCPPLYKQYQVQKQTLKQRTTKTIPLDRELWHGTAPEAIRSINKTGFDRSYCGKNATFLGEGVYFAVHAHYSAQDKYSRPDQHGNKHMYLVDVLTGEYTQGSGEMKFLPAKDPAKPEDKYDSAVDNKDDPSIFVIFQDVQAYPKYLITFQ